MTHLNYIVIEEDHEIDVNQPLMKLQILEWTYNIVGQITLYKIVGGACCVDNSLLPKHGIFKNNSVVSIYIHNVKDVTHGVDEKTLKIDGQLSIQWCKYTTYFGYGSSNTNLLSSIVLVFGSWVIVVIVVIIHVVDAVHVVIVIVVVIHVDSHLYFLYTWLNNFKFFAIYSKMSEPGTEIPISDPTTTTEPVKEQVPEPVTEPEPTTTTEPVLEPVLEPVPEPTIPTILESVAEPTISTIVTSDLSISTLVVSISTSSELSTTVEIPAAIPFSIEDLINSCDVVLAKETTDRTSVLNFVNMSIDSIKPKLYIWASIGFPSSYMVSTFELTAPATCSDGVRRTHLEYFEYLMNGKMNDWLNSMNAKTSGMYFTFSHNGYSCINLHISK